MNIDADLPQWAGGPVIFSANPIGYKHKGDGVSPHPVMGHEIDRIQSGVAAIDSEEVQQAHEAQHKATRQSGSSDESYLNSSSSLKVNYNNKIDSMVKKR